jgi:hypothetical protein
VSFSVVTACFVLVGLFFSAAAFGTMRCFLPLMKHQHSERDGCQTKKNSTTTLVVGSASSSFPTPGSSCIYSRILLLLLLFLAFSNSRESWIPPSFIIAICEA